MSFFLLALECGSKNFSLAAEASTLAAIEPAVGFGIIPLAGNFFHASLGLKLCDRRLS